MSAAEGATSTAAAVAAFMRWDTWTPSLREWRLLVRLADAELAHVAVAYRVESTEPVLTGLWLIEGEHLAESQARALAQQLRIEGRTARVVRTTEEVLAW